MLSLPFLCLSRWHELTPGCTSSRSHCCACAGTSSLSIFAIPQSSMTLNRAVIPVTMRLVCSHCLTCPNFLPNFTIFHILSSVFIAIENQHYFVPLFFSFFP